MELESLSRQLNTVSLMSPLTVSSHCKLSRGDIIGGYEIGEVLGKGRFSTVYHGKNARGDFAIKIYRMGGDNAEYYENEVKILNRIFEYSMLSQSPPTNLIGYMGTFAHVAIGHDRAPKIHPCVLFNLGGDSVSRLLRYCRRTYGNGLPLGIVKKIMRDTLTGLAYLHKCNIIHTDIKPSNLLLNGRVEALDAAKFSVNIGDLGSSTFTDKFFSHHIGTTQYIAPEVIIEQPIYTTAVDIWAAFAMCFELITGDYLFDVYGECGITYGEDVDGMCNDDVCDESNDDFNDEFNNESNDESNDTSLRMDHTHDILAHYASDDDGDSSGSEDEEDEEKTNYRHLLLIEKVIGPAPHEFTSDARKYYNRRDKLRENPDIERIGIAQLLYSNYDMEPNDCEEVERFLLKGLTYMPELRITAEAALADPFLN